MQTTEIFFCRWSIFLYIPQALLISLLFLPSLHAVYSKKRFNFAKGRRKIGRQNKALVDDLTNDINKELFTSVPNCI